MHLRAILQAKVNLKCLIKFFDLAERSCCEHKVVPSNFIETTMRILYRSFCLIVNKSNLSPPILRWTFKLMLCSCSITEKNLLDIDFIGWKHFIVGMNFEPGLSDWISQMATALVFCEKYLRDVLHGRTYFV